MIDTEHIVVMIEAVQLVLVVLAMIFAWRIGKRTGFFEGWGLFVIGQCFIIAGRTLDLSLAAVEPDDIIVVLAFHLFLVLGGILICVGLYRILLAAEKIRGNARTTRGHRT